VRRKVRDLETLRDKGRAPKAGRTPTVEQWMKTYLTDIASLKLKPRSLDDYWSKTRNDIIPGIGKHRLDKLQPEHLERMYRVMLDEGHAPSHVLKVHRLTWRHGCTDPHACGARLHRFEPCPPDCAAHKHCKRGCPKPCPKDCTRHASACPERKNGGLVFTRPKTKKSTNPVPIPPPFIPYLREHREQQDEMRAAAGEVWQEHKAVFTRSDGRPLDPRQDWEEFGSRHTAGTILNELGVDMPTIMQILRHTQISQTRRYVKGRSHLSKDAMRRMGDHFMPQPEPTIETTDSRTARARRRRRIRQKQKPQVTASES
jgi:hypothetical protein